MPQPTKTFGRYHLIQKIAQGGMAEIFLAKFRGAGGFEKKVIIKRILPRFSQNQEFIKMLVHEAKLAVQLHHANIVQIYDLGRVRDTYFISMEYIKGRDLRTVTNRLLERGERSPLPIAAFVAREVCKGLDYAHATVGEDGVGLNLVHRDISPPNVLLSLDGEVKIIDFGIAKATAKATDTQAGVFKGKFAYMSPEQAAGKRIDRRTDIFATGLVLYEMLTGLKLLDAESDMATLERARNVDQLDLRMGAYGVPAELEGIVRRSLAGDPERRYQTAGEMARDLTIFLNTRYPTFTDSEAGAFMRRLFNLDRRDAQAEDDTDPSLIPSLTGSLELIDDRPPSVRTTQNLAGRRAAAAASAGDESGVWALEAELEADLGAEIEVEAASGMVALAAGPAPTGWVSQVSPERRGDDDTGARLRPQVPAPVETSVERTLHGASTGAGGDRRWVGVILAAALLLGAALGALLSLPTAQITGLPGPVRALRHQARAAMGLPTLAVVSVAVTPAEAELKIDGLPVPPDGQALVATGAPHRVEATLEGHRPASWQVLAQVDGDRVPVGGALEPLPKDAGSARLLSDPAGARILVDGREQPGVLTPASLSGLPTDRPVRVTALLAGYRPAEVDVQAVEGEGAVTTLTLEKLPVALSVRSTPDGARVLLDGRPLDGVTPVDGALLVADAVYRITVEKDGFQPYEETLRTTIGKDLELRVSLAAVGAGATKGATREEPVALPASPRARAPQGRVKPSGDPAEAQTTEVRALAALEPQALAASPPEVAPASVNVIVLPERLPTEVYLNGDLIGTAPIRNRPMRPGEYTLRLRSQDANLDRAWQKVILDADAGKTLNWEFEIAATEP